MADITFKGTHYRLKVWGWYDVCVFFFKEVSSAPMIHLIDQKFSENYNIVK